MEVHSLFVSALVFITLGSTARGEPIPVRHVQGPMHRLMMARSGNGTVIARGEFSQVVQGDEVTMRLTYHFVDGSIDEETTTYRQNGVFRVVRNHHLQEGPFFSKPTDFAVDAPTSTATTRTTDNKGEIHVENEHVDVPDDVANGFVGTLLLNVPTNTAPFRVGMLVPVGGGRLIRLLISREGDEPFYEGGRALTATVFRIHPELGGMVGWIARLIGLQPKDVMV